MNRKLLIFLFVFLLSFKTNVYANGIEHCAGVAKILNKEINIIEIKNDFEKLNDEEKEMLQKIAIAESNVDGVKGMAYVIRVILNRVESEKFPNTIKEVIFQKNPTQFSTIPNGDYNKAVPNEDSLEACKIAVLYFENDALYFENDYGKESTWHSRNLKYVFKYKHHKFYK